ncbi:MAG: Cro/CI family transcriptional regulator [Candidatus Thiodiazotropha taylori]|nr:Cro/CI family transcriptional regulator [Candidatus Thiodiazotropha taylori]
MNDRIPPPRAGQIIDEFGGTKAVAELFGIREPSVSGWRKNGIPGSRAFSLSLMRPDLFESEAA